MFVKMIWLSEASSEVRERFVKQIINFYQRDEWLKVEIDNEINDLLHMRTITHKDKKEIENKINNIKNKCLGKG